MRELWPGDVGDASVRSSRQLRRGEGCAQRARLHLEAVSQHTHHINLDGSNSTPLTPAEQHFVDDHLDYGQDNTKEDWGLQCKALRSLTEHK